MLISDLEKQSKKQEEKVFMPSIHVMPQNNVQEEKKVVVQQEIKPIMIEPLGFKERTQLKKWMDEGHLGNNTFAENMFKKFDKQLQSIPDHVNHKPLTNLDKLNMLVGDYNDHQNTKFTIQKDKTVTFESEKGQGIMNNQNSMFSQKQLDLKAKQEVKQDVKFDKGFSI